MYTVLIEEGVEEYKKQVRLNKEILENIDDNLLRKIAEYAKKLRMIGRYYNLYPIILSKINWSDKQRYVITSTISRSLTTEELREVIEKEMQSNH